MKLNVLTGAIAISLFCSFSVCRASSVEEEAEAVDKVKASLEHSFEDDIEGASEAEMFLDLLNKGETAVINPEDFVHPDEVQKVVAASLDL